MVQCPEPKIELLTETSLFDQPQKVKAEFTLGKCFADQRVQICFVYCQRLNGSWRHQFYKKHATTSRCGVFKVTVPAHTTEFKLTVKLIEREQCLKLVYVDSPCKSTPLSYLVEADLTLFLAVRFAITLAIDTSGLDHAGAKEQAGPCRASRAICIAFLAAFEALNAVDSRYHSYIGLLSEKKPISREAAILQATVETLVTLFPSQSARLNSVLVDALAQIKASERKTAGIALGHLAATTVLNLRADDGSAHPEQRVGNGPDDYHVDPAAGKWSPDPVSQVPIALGSRWSEVKPFVLASASQFRCPNYPPLDSAEYAMCYNEVKCLGGTTPTPTVRSDDATVVGIYWGFDGSRYLGAPPRLYNQIAIQLATSQQMSPIEFARMIAVINVAMADGAIAAWESKYYYNLWRPVTAIRRAAETGNVDTVADPTFTPLGAPASNTQNGVNFTPPFPAMPSGHSCFGSVLFEILRSTFGRDDIAFTFVSEEYNGVTTDNHGIVRPFKPRSFTSLSQAEEENGQSRMMLGSHFNVDKTTGRDMGHKVAHYVNERIFFDK